MSEMRTEEEQIEAIKNWWKENGKQTIAAVVIVAGGWFGYQGYESNKQAQGEAASAVYEQVLELSNSGQESDLAQRELLLNQLKTDFSSTVYAAYAALFKAKDAMQSNDLERAASELQFALDNAPTDAIAHMAKIRLARVYIAQENTEQALSLLAVEEMGAFEGEYEETKGDALFAQGDVDAARDAYSKAVAANARLGANNPLVEMKLDDLAAN